MAVMILLSNNHDLHRDEQPEWRIHSARRAMRNPEGVSHKPEPKA